MSLTVSDLRYSYPGADRPALDGVSFTLGDHEYAALLGANGSGKSTLARCVAKLLVAGDGSISVEARPPADAALDGARAYRVPVAMVFQSPQDQIVSETVKLDVAFGPENIGLPRELIGERVASSLAEYGLSGYADAPTGSLSTGFKQHLALAGVHALEPSLLVLDEPTAMLAPRARESVLSAISRFRAEGGAILHVTHDRAEAARADRVLVLDRGRLAFDGTSAEFSALPRATIEQWGLIGEVLRRSDARASGDTVVSADATASSPVANAPAVVLSCAGVSAGPLSNVNLEFRAGTVTAVTGESGTGKSLLLEMLAGLRASDEGIVAVGDGLAVALAAQESEASLFCEFVADDVAFGPQNAGLSGAALVGRVRASMERVSLPFADFADRRTFSLSGGERRKAALAGIVAMNADIVLLDEPTSALDARSRSQFLSLILALRDEGKTVVFTTNRLEEREIADAVVSLDELPGRDVAGVSSVAASKGASSRRVLTPNQAKIERLRTASRGAGAQGDTVLSRLPPAFKYWLLACGVVASLAIPSIPFLAVAVAFALALAAVARYPARALLRGILSTLPWLALFGVIQYALYRDLLFSVAFAVRFVALYVPIVTFVFICSHTEIMYGMEDLLVFLKPLRVPVRDLSLVTGIVFRFIPLLYEEAARIETARMIRSGNNGSRAGKSFLFGKIASMASLFVPLMMRTLTRAERLSSAITARYYGSAKNTRFLHWKIGFWQTILMIAVTALTVLLILLSYYFGK